VVLFPSTWEGFGNPVIESVVARRPLVVGGYPVLDEITACGLRFFALDAPAALADWLRAPDPAILEENRRRAQARYDLADLPRELDAAFRSHGWTTW
jgi:mannosylglucosylglycerate synthase